MKKRLVLFTATFTLFAATATAFLSVEVIFEGSHTSPLASGPAPITGTLAVGFAEGLAPGGSEPVTIEPNNETGHTVTATKIEIEAVKTSAVGCLPAWFAVEPTNTAAKELVAGTAKIDIAAGKAPLAEATWKLSFAETVANQSACEKQGVTVGFKLKAA
jgi:hypothetical protein